MSSNGRRVYGSETPAWQVPSDGVATGNGKFAWRERLLDGIGGKKVGSAAIVATGSNKAHGYLHLDGEVILVGDGEIHFNDDGSFRDVTLDIRGGTGRWSDGGGQVVIDVENPKRYTVPN